MECLNSHFFRDRNRLLGDCPPIRQVQLDVREIPESPGDIRQCTSGFPGKVFLVFGFDCDFGDKNAGNIFREALLGINEYSPKKTFDLIREMVSFAAGLRFRRDVS